MCGTTSGFTYLAVGPGSTCIYRCLTDIVARVAHEEVVAPWNVPDIALVALPCARPVRLAALHVKLIHSAEGGIGIGPGPMRPRSTRRDREFRWGDNPGPWEREERGWGSCTGAVNRSDVHRPWLSSRRRSTNSLGFRDRCRCRSSDGPRGPRLRGVCRHSTQCGSGGRTPMPAPQGLPGHAA